MIRWRGAMKRIDDARADVPHVGERGPAAGSTDAVTRDYVDRYARLLARDPSTPQAARNRIGRLIRRLADPEPPFLRLLPEMLSAVFAAFVTIILAASLWIAADPFPLFVSFSVAFLVAYPVAMVIRRRVVDRRRVATLRELEVLLPS